MYDRSRPDLPPHQQNLEDYVREEDLLPGGDDTPDRKQAASNWQDYRFPAFQGRRPTPAHRVLISITLARRSSILSARRNGQMGHPAPSIGGKFPTRQRPPFLPKPRSRRSGPRKPFSPLAQARVRSRTQHQIRGLCVRWDCAITIGRKLIGHTGGVAGFVSRVMLVPKKISVSSFSPMPSKAAL